MAPAASNSRDALAPLRSRTFAVLWSATIFGNVAAFMRDLTNARTASELSASPASVAMIKAAATLPAFLLAIPAGVLTDLLDRRRLLLMTQATLAVVSALLFWLALKGHLNLPNLLLLSVIGGVCAALMAPAWLAIVPELVAEADRRNAFALNSLGINIARAIGPAAGGLLVASTGTAAAYGTTLLMCMVPLVALGWWRRNPAQPDPLAEQFFGALRAGLRYSRASPDLHRVLWRAAAFFGCASCVWAMLPWVARRVEPEGAWIYGVLLGAVGLGAVVGALCLPRLRERFGAEELMEGASLSITVALVGAASLNITWTLVLLMLLLGAAWITALTTLLGAAQSFFPAWVRGRGLAIYLTVFNGAMSFGSLAWGAFAEKFRVSSAMLFGAAFTFLGLVWADRHPLPAGQQELQPGVPWPAPDHALSDDRGPVIVQVEYRVKNGQMAEAIKLIRELALVRRRDGADAWGLYEDAESPGRLIEWFSVESWTEHLRQHRRGTTADAALRSSVRAVVEVAPVVRHLLSMDGRKV